MNTFLVAMHGKLPVIVSIDGKVVEEGAPSELLAKENGLFRRMSMLQSESLGWSV